jgi:hypothetical protein
MSLKAIGLFIFSERENGAEDPGPGFFRASAVEVLTGPTHAPGAVGVYCDNSYDYYNEPVHGVILSNVKIVLRFQGVKGVSFKCQNFFNYK